MQYDAIGNQRDQGRSKKNQNQKIKGLNLDLSLELGTASTVVQTIHIGNVQLTGKIVRHVVKRTTLQKSVGLGKAKAKALVLPRNRSNIGKLM